MGRTEKSVVHFQTAMSVNDQNVEAYAGLAVALHRIGKVEAAEEMLTSAKRIAGNSDILLGQLGQLELEAEAAADVDAAFDPAQQSIKIDAAHEAQREWLEAQVGRYQAILEQHPTWTDIRLRCGMLLKLIGRCDEAIRCFEQATRENPGYAEAWVQMGLTRYQIGDTTGGLRALETAIQIRPDYADLRYRLGLIYCGEMEFDLAMERLENAGALNKQNPEFHRQLWVALESMQMRGRRATAHMAQRTEPITNEAA
jgi:tetratricopeptide (TPR) repeat protein